WLDPRTLGGETQSKTSAVLPVDGGGSARPGAATQEVAGVRRSRGPNRGSATCLNGTLQLESIWQEGISGRSGKRKSSRSFPIICNKGMKNSEHGARTTTRLSAS